LVWQHLTLYVQFCAPDGGWRNRLKRSISSTIAAGSSNVLTIPVAVCTVLCSWWWAEEQPETCRATYRNKNIEKTLHLVGCTWDTCGNGNMRSWQDLSFSPKRQVDNKERTYLLLLSSKGQSSADDSTLVYLRLYATLKQDTQCNIGAHLCNHCWTEKAVRTTYSECVFLAFGIQNAKRMRRNTSSPVACLATPYFFQHYFISGMTFGGVKRLQNVNYVAGSSLQLLSETFLILKKNYATFHHYCIEAYM
jgi:hypothetical protein